MCLTRLRHKQQSFGLALYLLDVADQRVAVLVPVGLERVLVGELVAAELQSDLKAVAAEVVEVLHPCGGRKGGKRVVERDKANVPESLTSCSHLQVRCTRLLHS